MANSQVSSYTPILASKANEITVGTTAPTSPTTGWVWVDTSITGSAVLKTWNGTSWVESSSNLALAAFLGGTF